MVLIPTREEWRYASMRHGVQFVMTCGPPWMQGWCAGNWASLQEVRFMLGPELIRGNCYAVLFPFSGATVATFGSGTGPIYLDNVQCLGTETTLSSCPYDSDTSDCFHFEDTGVRC